MAKKKVEINTEKFWFYRSCKFCKCLINKDLFLIAKRGVDIVKKNIEISEIIRKHFEIDFLKNLLLNKEELRLFKYQFKNLNLNNMIITKSYLDYLYNGHFMEEDNQMKSDEK